MSPVAFYVPTLEGGGAEKVFARLAGGFAEAGCPTDLLVAQRKGPFAARVSPAVRVLSFEVRRVSRTLPALVRYLRARRPAVLFSALHANLVALAAQRLAGGATRAVITEHSGFSHAAWQARTLNAKAYAFLARWGYGHAEAAVAVSEGAADDLARNTTLARERIAVIYNPIVDAHLQRAMREPPPHPWLSGERVPVVVGAGRLAPEKDFATLVEAFARVRRRQPVRLILLGEGKERAPLERLAARRGVRADVALPGFVENPYAYMRAASVFALSSRSEGLGNVLVEAMACGTPVVSTDCPHGPSEILRGGALGPLVPVGDAFALAAAIRALLARPTPRQALQRRAQDFSLSRALRAYRALVPCPR